MLDILLWPFRLVFSAIGWVFSLIGGLVGLVFGVAGGILSAVLSGVLLVLGVLAVWFVARVIIGLVRCARARPALLRHRVSRRGAFCMLRAAAAWWAERIFWTLGDGPDWLIGRPSVRLLSAPRAERIPGMPEGCGYLLRAQVEVSAPVRILACAGRARRPPERKMHMPCPCRTSGARAALCALSADFSAVVGERILPFLISLDEANSVLYPEAGQRQRFCYALSARGADAPAYADLSHFVLSLCPRVTEAMLANVTVTRNGVSEPVVIGDNVEIRPVDSPDPPTGCPGLKFDFALDKVDGEMLVCFELTETFPVGPMPVCLYGGGVTAGGLSVCGPVCEAQGGCTATAYHRSTVCVPVTVTPRVTAGQAVSTCCGAPVLTPGASVCPGVRNGSCTFTLTQRLCVAVPVVFSADAEADDYHVLCGGVSGVDCEDCAAEDNGTARTE